MVITMSDTFKIGDRVCFGTKYGFIQYGNVEKMDHDGQRLAIRGDDARIYEGWTKDVINLSDSKEKTK